MNLQVLIATMYKEDYSLLEEINLQSDAVVINQCNKNSYNEIKRGPYRIIWIDTIQRGLSKSRNMALSYATADVCLIADDDEILANGYPEIIANAFSKTTNADIISFNFETIHRDESRGYLKKNRDKKSFRFRYYASVSLAIKLSKIKKYGICFNEYLGAGTKYGFGEETAFEEVCRRKGLTIYENSCKICSVTFSGSTWFNGFNEDFYVATGVLLAITFGRFAGIFSIYYLYQSRKTSKLSLKTVAKKINEGILIYKNI